MPLSISARFLANCYQGRDSGGVPERYPSADRLYKALVSTAYTTFQFKKQRVHSAEGLDDADIELALRWLEGNPPDAVYLPPAISDSEGESANVTVYRDKGYIDSTKGKKRSKVASANAAVSVYYDDAGRPLTWQWKDIPPSEALAALVALCAEVPYLGEACSKVRLSVSVEEQFPLVGALLRDESDGFETLRAHGLVFAYPGCGRLEDLDDGYARNNFAPGKPVREREDEQNLLQSSPMNSTVGIATYLRPKHDLKALVPWPRGILIPVTPDAMERMSDEWNPPESEYVGWAVALHRFLVKEWGIDPPAALIGKYQKDAGMPQPANNIAIHLLTERIKAKYADVLPDMIVDYLPALLLMLPEHMPDDEVIELYETCKRSAGRSLYFSRNSQRVRLGEPIRIDTARFWNPPATGTVRFWFPSPMSIAETRAIPDPAGRRHWGSREALYLSLGHVWRDHFLSDDRASKYEERMWSFVDRVRRDESLRFRVLDARTVHRPNMIDYIHRAHMSNVVRGLSALIAIGSDVCDLNQAVLAIGQSRHLGGGFLLPVDLPANCLGTNDCDGQEVPIWLT
ncbi:type I-U CRISPR-associated protein Csb2 [Bifidobacterium phasiani]|uniref:Type I-U CRISPR-associated protein Cas5/Cas6 n=1 Tax=Bifidobacterium phasiani TaxID=2834431 RepID=A0ABS6W9D2_9BIFI|nr:type I-U CRISPR-associated protein Csb2 [Bifidobacterium phasiani]MBW3083108.1 type I-U CRISPR-associated protein Cas5/Cas6 [Bifidobacterium phasiani]